MNWVLLAEMDTLPNKGIVAKLIDAVAADAVSLVIAMLVTATATLAGDVYSVVLEVAAAPLYRVIDVSDATILIPSKLVHLLTIGKVCHPLAQE